MGSGNRHRPKLSSTLSRLVASVLAAMLSLAGLVAIGPAAYAATPGISISSLLNGSAISDDAVVNPGDTLTLRVRYDESLDASQPVEIGLDGAVTLDESTLEVPAGNTAIEKIEHVDGTLLITFNDTEQWDVHQGIYDLNFVFDEVEHTGSETIQWTVNGEPTTLEVIVRNPGDEEGNVSNSVNKSIGGASLDQYVSVDDGSVVVSEDILNEKLNYTLSVNTDSETERSEFTITDELSDYLSYNGDFSAELSTWDETGWNKTTEDFDFSPEISGNSFTTTIDVPSPSELKVTYTASVSQNGLVELQAALQEAYDALDGEPGSYQIGLENTANFGGEESHTNVNIGGRITAPEPPGTPNLGQAFWKSVDQTDINIETDDNGELVEPVDLTYTFKADLSQWDADEERENPEDWTLDQNVVIHDKLPEQAQWNTDADGFIAAGDFELTQATDFEGTVADFAADSYVSQYAVVGQELFINIGRDQDTNVSIDVRALVTSIEGIHPWTNQQGWDYYEIRNDAAFSYRDGDPFQESVITRLIDRGDTSEGVNDPNTFSKTADTDGIAYVDQGEPLTVDYQFVVQGVDVTKSSIVDQRDPNIFDFTDEDVLAEIQDNISGEYQWWRPMGPEHFDVSVDDNGDLVIQLSETGIEFVGTDVDNHLVVNVPLTTTPFDRKQTVTIENHATLHGEDEEELYWSETTSEVSSYGDEAEVRKTIRDSANQQWTQNLRVDVADGELVQDEYVYNLAFIPHGNYHGVSIVPVVDELPEEVEFLGFVADDDVDNRQNADAGPVDIGGNLEAIYDTDTHSVTVQTQDGEVLEQDENISANVLVRVVDFEEDTPVINIFGNSSATYTPSDGYPLAIHKVDSEDDDVVINDPDSRFNILDEDDNIVVEDAFVSDGQLRVLDDDGDITGLVVSEPGTYFVEEVVAPAGYELSSDRIQVVVNEDGSSEQVEFPNVPTEVGLFSVVKLFDDADDLLSEDDRAGLEFTVEYTYEDADGEQVTDSLIVGGDGESVDSPELPAGSQVSLSEVELPEVEGLQWGTPEFSQETVEVAAGETVEVELTNVVSPEDPTDPADPEDPTDPVDPVDPEDSEDPEDSDDPESPTEPADPEKSEEPQGPEDSDDTTGSEDGTSDDQDDKLALTGTNLAILLGAVGLALLLAGGGLYARNRKSNEA